MKKILTEPLFHFFLIGALMFWIFAAWQDSDGASRDKIVVSKADITALQATFTRTWQRQPTASELEGLVEDKIRDEIAYREALAMGLDKEDAYIKRRLRMKLELLFEDIDSLTPPTDEELEEFLEHNREKFREDAQISFSQIYFDVERHKNSLEGDVGSLLARLNNSATDIDLEAYGDPTLLPRTYALTPANVIDRQLGAGFFGRINTAEIGTWQGPILSGYGYHLVLVHAYQAGRDPELSEIRPLVEREYLAKRRNEFTEAAYTKLQQKYEIVRKTTENSNS